MCECQLKILCDHGVLEAQLALKRFSIWPMTFVTSVSPDPLFSHASAMALWIAMSLSLPVCHLGPDWNISTTIQWIELCTDINAPKRQILMILVIPWLLLERHQQGWVFTCAVKSLLVLLHGLALILDRHSWFQVKQLQLSWKNNYTGYLSHCNLVSSISIKLTNTLFYSYFFNFPAVISVKLWRSDRDYLGFMRNGVH